MMIKAIFYARFEPSRGPIILHDYPPGIATSAPPTTYNVPESSLHNTTNNLTSSIHSLPTLTSDPRSPPLPTDANTLKHPSSSQPQVHPILDFARLSDFLIPRQEFCGDLFSIVEGNYRILGYPVCIKDENRYERNEFNYNFCVVLQEAWGDGVAHRVAERKDGHRIMQRAQKRARSEEEGSHSSDDSEEDDDGQGEDLAPAAQRATLTGVENMVRKLARATHDAEVFCGWLSQDEKEVWLREVREARERKNAAASTVPARGMWIDENGVVVRWDGEDDLHLTRPDTAGTVTAEPIEKTFDGTSRVAKLIASIFQQINAVGECDLLIDNVLAFHHKLWPPRRQHGAQTIPNHAVPVPQTPLADLEVVSQDLTMRRVLPLINGVRSVREIARKADADMEYVRVCLADLMQCEAVVLVDKFFFGAVYACTPAMRAASARRDVMAGVWRSVYEMDQESAALGPDTRHENKEADADEDVREGQNKRLLTLDEMMQLFSQFRHGLTVKKWVLGNLDLLAGTQVDVRRLVTVGVIKGLLYRVQKYPCLPHGSSKDEGLRSAKSKGRESQRSKSQLRLKHDGVVETALSGFTDGTHCLDEICTELRMSEKEVLAHLRSRWRDIQII